MTFDLPLMGPNQSKWVPTESPSSSFHETRGPFFCWYCAVFGVIYETPEKLSPENHPSPSPSPSPSTATQVLAVEHCSCQLLHQAVVVRALELFPDERMKAAYPRCTGMGMMGTPFERRWLWCGTWQGNSHPTAFMPVIFFGFIQFQVWVARCWCCPMAGRSVEGGGWRCWAECELQHLSFSTWDLSTYHGYIYIQLYTYVNGI